MTDIEELKKAATVSITRAAEVVADLSSDLDRIRTITKDDRSPVTVADFAAQAIVGLSLRGCPVDAMVGEEDATRLREDEAVRNEVVDAVRRALPDATPESVIEAIDSVIMLKLTGSFWTLDPIDGTKVFEGGPHSLSRSSSMDESRWVSWMSPLGVATDPGGTVQLPGTICVRSVVAPMRGAWVNPGGIPRTQDRGLSDERAIRTCESVESAHTSHDASSRIVEIFAAHEAVRLDSQTKYAVVASGAADAYLRLPTSRIRRADLGSCCRFPRGHRGWRGGDRHHRDHRFLEGPRPRRQPRHRLCDTSGA